MWNSQPYAPSGAPPAQYQQQYPPSTSAWNTGKQGEEKSAGYGNYEEQRFKPKKKVNDIPVLIFFILTVRIIFLLGAV